jgi:site-specific recombinase XerD
MSQVKIILRKDKVSKSGEHPLNIRIYKNRRYSFKSLKINCRPELFDEIKEEVKSKFPNSAHVNYEIKRIKAEWELKLLKYSKDHSSLESFITSFEPKTIPSLTECANEYLANIERGTNYGTQKDIRSKLKKFSDFNKNKDLKFEQFTLEYLKKYMDHLYDIGNSQSTVEGNLKVIKTIIKKAIKEGIIEEKNNPFNKITIKRVNPEKHFLIESELLALKNLKLTPGSIKAITRDAFIFATYGGGIRVSDLLNLKINNYSEGKVQFFVKKTKMQHSILLLDPAKEIIEKYIGDRKGSDYIFPLLDTHEINNDLRVLNQKTESKTALLNKTLKLLAKEADVEKKLTFHVSRHTFATLALKNEVPIVRLSKILGHANIQQTMIYGKIVPEDQDNSMKMFNEKLKTQNN